MYTREEIWSSFVNEFRIIKHLAEKIPAGKEHHKPTEKQRTTLELLQYISRMGKGILRAILESNAEGFTRYTEASQGVTVENFQIAIDEQVREMKELFDLLTDEELAKELTLWGMTEKKSMFVLNALKMVTAYKMQLFLYIKASGNESIGTSNLWAGMDMPSPKDS